MSQDFLEYSIAILLKRQRFIINSFQSCSIPMFNLTFDGMFFNPYIIWGGSDSIHPRFTCQNNKKVNVFDFLHACTI